MTRVLYGALLGAGVLLTCSPGPVTAALSLGSCRTLTGKDLAASAAAKVVRRPVVGGRTRLLGCATPRGRVRALTGALGTDSAGIRESASVLTSTGPFVVVKHSESVAAGGSTSSRVVDLRNGRGHTYFSASSSEEYSSFTTLGRPAVEVMNLPGAVRAHLDATGRLAVAFTGRTTDDAAKATVVIAVFTAAGRRTVVDQGAPNAVVATSLRLSGGVARWRSGDIVRRARVG
jgi:hypothetical protein